MENKINIAQLLKDCPKGMELDCTMLDDVVFEKISFGVPNYPIVLKRLKTNTTTYLTKYGQYSDIEDYKCVIFPKGRTSWEGFQRPFKDGDIVFYNDTIAIFKEWGDETLFRTYVTKYLCCDSCVDVNVPLFGKSVRREIRFATEEEKQKLFKAIKEQGYKWNAETKTLEKIVPKFKDGDVVVAEYCGIPSYQLFLLEHLTCSKNDNSYDGDCYFGWDFRDNRLFEKGNWGFSRLATEEEKEKLFDTIKANGYRWNRETKILERIEPKFKVGDIIRHKNGYSLDVSILKINADCYTVKDFMGDQITIDFTHQDNYELVPNKFDINTLVPFESKVLVRSYTDGLWRPAIFGMYIKKDYIKDKDNLKFAPYYVQGGTYWKYCIPYEGNEHLLGTTDDCDKFYKTWE